MRSMPDPIDRLAAADPLESEQLGPAERREADALLARLVAEPVEAPPRRRPVRRMALAVASTAAALVLVLVGVDLLDDDTPGPDIVARAVAAVTGENSVFHTVQLVRFHDLDSEPPTVSAYIEAWHGPDRSMHTKMYGVRGGRRGRLLSETTERLRPRGGGRSSGVGQVYNPRTDTIRESRFVPTWLRQRQPVELDPRRDPGLAMRELERRGRLRVDGRTRVDGREAYRLVSGVVPGFAPGLKESYVYLVDAETYYPLKLRYRFGKGGDWAEGDIRYLVYERLPLDAAGRAALRMDPHPGAKLEQIAPRR
jgi:hypothetical protein